MIVIGADVGKGCLVCAVVKSDKIKIRDFNLFGEFHTITANAEGISKLLALKPDVVVMEPTGVNYLKIWIAHLARAGVEIALVGHKQLRSHRIDQALPDKDDYADSLALANYYLTHKDDPIRFVRIRDRVTSQLRDRVLMLKHLDRLKNAIGNRLKQDLAWAFPEMAEVSDSAVLFWAWLAGERKSVKYDALLAQSCGEGLNFDIRSQASLLTQVLRDEIRVEREMIEFLSHPQYIPYLSVLRKYAMGDRIAALVISQFFPLSNFLGEDGQPIVLLAPSKRTGKLTKRHISLRRFRKTLGVAPTREQSGNSPEKTKKAGSQLVRNALWMWIWRNFERSTAKRNPFINRELLPLWEEIKNSESAIAKARSRFASKVIDRLFYDLVDANHT